MRLYTIDANGISHWLWHANRIDENGNEISLNDAIKKWFAEFSERLTPSHVVACFDGKGNWRKQVSVEYKSARLAKPIDEEKLAALKAAPDAWREMGVPVLTFDGFEADDTIAALCNTFASEECEVINVATDKDLMQLVGQNVKQYDPRPNKANECVFYDASKVEEKLGVPPHRVAELLSIMGDSSDSVEGVPDWGKVRAVNAIRQTKSLFELLRKAKAGTLQNISIKMQAVLIENMPALQQSMQLVSLRVDVPVPTEISAFELRNEEAA